MLRITVEILPHGSESNKKTLGIMNIWNNVTGSSFIGNYSFKIFRRGSENTIWKTGNLNGFKRLRYGVWDLLYHCLKEILSDRDCISK